MHMNLIIVGMLCVIDYSEAILKTKSLDGLPKIRIGRQSKSVEEKGDKCYGELGCFPVGYPWTSAMRPLPPPQPPTQVNVRLYLYTRDARTRYTVTLWPKISIQGSDYKPDRPTTVFITHGFANNGNLSWISKLKDAYLKSVDANVFITDWGDGAQEFSYLQVASNTRIVGAELTRFGKFLMKSGLKPENIHLIGHSLGSHISSYMAKGIKPLGRPKKLTALDPAQPGFEGLDERVRLSVDDADYIDAIHSDAKPFIPLMGFGIMRPTATVDIYINRGSYQPGCAVEIDTGDTKIQSIADLGTVSVEVVSRWFGCSHERSYKILTYALNDTNCKFWGRPIKLPKNFQDRINNLNEFVLPPILKNQEECTLETCILLGLKDIEQPLTGTFVAKTTSKPPYCVGMKSQDDDIVSKIRGRIASFKRG